MIAVVRSSFLVVAVPVSLLLRGGPLQRVFLCLSAGFVFVLHITHAFSRCGSLFLSDLSLRAPRVCVCV